MHLYELLDRFELTDGCLLAIVADNASSNYGMTQEVHSTLEASGIEWPALSNHIPCLAHVIQLALSSLMNNLGVKGPLLAIDQGNVLVVQVRLDK